MRPAGQLAILLDRAGPLPAPADVASALPAISLRADPAEQGCDRLASDWAELAAAAAEPNCFAEPWFVAASLAGFGRARGVRLLEVRRGDRLIGLMPVAAERHYGRIPVRYTQNWHHEQMFLGTPLVRAGEETAFWSAALEALDEADWAPSFLHVRGLVEDGPIHRGLAEAAAARGRACAVVHRETRAMLAGDLDPETYYRRTVRHKKRKEIKRLKSRLAELGTVRARYLERAAELDGWCDAFLALEQAGWKGKAGTALACTAEGEAFFRRALAGAWSARRLQFLRLGLDDRPIAMLVNFLAPPGSFSFKTAFDEAYARFSPGVLVQLENLAILGRDDIDWMDSCAVERHPMIESLWSGRRRIVRVTVRLRGLRRTAVFAACRALETASAARRHLFAGAIG